MVKLLKSANLENNLTICPEAYSGLFNFFKSNFYFLLNIFIVFNINKNLFIFIFLPLGYKNLKYIKKFYIKFQLSYILNLFIFYFFLFVYQNKKTTQQRITPNIIDTTIIVAFLVSLNGKPCVFMPKNPVIRFSGSITADIIVKM